MSGNTWRDRYFTSQDGLQLYYRDFASPGSGRTPVLCLPGLTRNSRDFETTALRLQHTRRVLCADLRGRGHAPSLDEPVCVEAIDAFLANVE